MKTIHAIRESKSVSSHFALVLTWHKLNSAFFAGEVDDSAQLEMAGREWAAKAFCVAASIDTLSAMATAKVTTPNATWRISVNSVPNHLELWVLNT